MRGTARYRARFVVGALLVDMKGAELTEYRLRGLQNIRAGKKEEKAGASRG